MRERFKQFLYRNDLNIPIKLIIIIILAIIFLITTLSIYLPNFRTVDYRDYNSIDKNEIILIIDNKIVTYEDSPVYKDNEVFVPVNLISKYIDSYIFWDTAENKLTITTENKVIRMKSDELEYFVNNKPLKLNIPAYSIDGLIYLPVNFLKELYNIGINYNQDLNILIIEDLKASKTTASIISKKSRLRYLNNKKSPIIQTLKLGDEVTIIGQEKDGYQKVRSKDGYIGYVLAKNLSEKTTIKGLEINNKTENKSIWKPEKGKINLVFDQITNVNANNTQAKRTTHKGLDVLVPTWFSFENENGDIKNIADINYVNWAHENNYQVWALITDNFDSKISKSILKSTTTREHVIKQLLAFVSIYNLDGINIDFESVPNDCGEYFIQFLRELGPLLKEQGAILSVDTFVPKPWTNHYNRKEIGKIADYVIVMGYDEHYAGSKTSGSVASISWSREAITSTLNQGVPKEKLILGIPFYTRIWTEEYTENGFKLSSKAYGMDAAYNFILERNGKFEWLENIGQYYGEVTQDNKTYKVWLEDETSIKKRLDLVLKYDIAGVGSWKRGLEVPYIWEILRLKLK